MAKQTTDLADQLRAAIRASGLSLNQLGQTTGVDSGRLSRFMRGERDLTLGASTSLCRLLGLELCASVGGGQPKANRGRSSGPASPLGGPPPIPELPARNDVPGTATVATPAKKPRTRLRKGK
jgi:transcriptional regulator with XRE-family HTH domain